MDTNNSRTLSLAIVESKTNNDVIYYPIDSNSVVINGKNLSDSGSESKSYTKEETDTLLANKQDTINDLITIRTNAQSGKIASDNLGGHTVAKDVPSNAVFTDTIYDDTELSGRVSTLETEIDDKVDKVQGKQLSTNDYTTEEKTKLAGLENTDIVDNLESIDATKALSANQGRVLNQRVNNMEGIGRFLSIWNSNTGLAESTPPSVPYTYNSGDYFRIGTIGTTILIPNGSTYTGEPSTTEYQGSLELEVGDLFIYDGQSGNWLAQKNQIGGKVQDVTLNGESIVNGSIASLQTDTAIDAQSTNNGIASSKAVWDLFNSIVNGNNIQY